MKIYLEYRETVDGWSRFLDRIIRLGEPTGKPGPLSVYLDGEEATYHMGDVVELTDKEILDMPLDKEYLFAKFGIRDLDLQGGIPKPGVFSVDDEVYKAIETAQKRLYELQRSGSNQVPENIEDARISPGKHTFRSR